MENQIPDGVTNLCAAGMTLEAQGKKEEAGQLFSEAWDRASGNLEKCIAAHYLARCKNTPGDRLTWNIKALEYARKSEDDAVNGYYPSLYLNIARSYEDLGRTGDAAHHYALAAGAAEALPDTPYLSMIRSGIHEGLKRTGQTGQSVLDPLINRWCETKQLKPLSLILPAYMSHTGSAADLARLLSALSYTSAAKCLIKEDQEELEQVIASLTPVP